MPIPTVYAELVERAEAVRLRVWSSADPDVREALLAPGDVAPLLRWTGADSADAGRRLFRWLDGREGRLAASIRSVCPARAVVLAISAPPRLARLPWEALHDGASFLVHAVDSPVLPVRWRSAPSAAVRPANRPLRALYMAASPRGLHPAPDHEREEAEILAATDRSTADLVVEESGSLDGLGWLMQAFGTEGEEYGGYFDVVHLAGHVAHGVPRFAFEDGEGGRADAGADEVARALPYRPRVLVLSASGIAGGDELARALVAAGFPAVLSHRADTALATRHVHRELAAGEPLAVAVLRAHAALLRAGAGDWHRLRLFVAGAPPGALVTPPRTPGRRRPAGRPAESEFLDPQTSTARVASRAAFVGRRRLLQDALRRLRAPDACAGVLLHGQGGRGKSSVAARLCDRLRDEARRVVVTGLLDEPSLVSAWASALPGKAARDALHDPAEELRYRIEAQLVRAAEDGLPAPLFVLDDFEQNQPRAREGDLGVTVAAAGALEALLDALERTGTGRVVVTGRYGLPAAFARRLHAMPVPPLDPTEQEKQVRRLEQSHPLPPRDPALRAAARALADGNPRLAEWLHRVLADEGIDHAALFARLRETEAEFRESILAGQLAARLSEPDRRMLGRMLAPRLPVPLGAIHDLVPGHSREALAAALDGAAALGLVDAIDEEDGTGWRVPRVLERLDPPLPGAEPGDAERWFDALFPRWGGEEADDRRAVELVRLGTERPAEVARLAVRATSRWLDAYRYAETKALVEAAMARGARDPLLSLNLARAVGALGDGDAEGALLEQARAACPPDRGDDRATIHFHLGAWMTKRGRAAEALRFFRETLLPSLHPRRDGRMRALALREVAYLVHRRGDRDEALRILTDEVLPAFRALDDERESAVTLGRVADMRFAQGELAEALRIRRDEVLPVFERLGDERERAMALGGIADVMTAYDDLDEALRIRRDEQLPAYERVMDARQRAVVLGKMADLFVRRGEGERALSLRREEQLPVFERLGDERGRAVALGKIADLLALRGDLAEALRIRREEQLPALDRVGERRGRAVAMGKIADLLHHRGETDEALRIRREEVLPVLDALPDLRARTRCIGKIADLLVARGELDEALRIRVEEQLPVYERLGDEGGRARARGKMADILAARGEGEEALRIRREEVLPVFERLGDARAVAVAQTRMADLLRGLGRADEAIGLLRDHAVPALERAADVLKLLRARVLLAELLLARDPDGGRDEAAGHLGWIHGVAVRGGLRQRRRIEELMVRAVMPVPEA